MPTLFLSIVNEIKRMSSRCFMCWLMMMPWSHSQPDWPPSCHKTETTFPTRMHSRRMYTARLLTVSCSAWGVCPSPSWWETSPGSRHIPLWRQTPVRRQTHHRPWGRIPPPEADTHPWTEWHTGVKTLPCPKLRLRAVITLYELAMIQLSCISFQRSWGKV